MRAADATKCNMKQGCVSERRGRRLRMRAADATKCNITQECVSERQGLRLRMCAWFSGRGTVAPGVKAGGWCLIYNYSMGCVECQQVVAGAGCAPGRPSTASIDTPSADDAMTSCPESRPANKLSGLPFVIQVSGQVWSWPPKDGLADGVWHRWMVWS